MLLPIVEQISTEVAATAKVGKVNVDDAQELARRYNVRNIPTLIFYKNGEEVDRITGMTSKDNILNRLRALM
jgi:thioredoxin 1